MALKKLKTTLAAVGLTVLFIVAIVLFVACFPTLQSAVEHRRELEREAAAELDPANAGGSLQTARSVADEDASSELTVNIADAEKAVVPFQQLSRDNGDEAWRRIQPHLVTLEIATPLGPRTATGLIVDPRGWVLTAYQPCRDASSIRVRETATTFEPLTLSDRLSDQVRGVVAIDVGRNLVLLSVNPRFAPLNRVAIDSADSLVQGRFPVSV